MWRVKVRVWPGFWAWVANEDGPVETKTQGQMASRVASWNMDRIISTADAELKRRFTRP
jgi:hypothetical protein